MRVDVIIENRQSQMFTSKNERIHATRVKRIDNGHEFYIVPKNSFKYHDDGPEYPGYPIWKKDTIGPYRYQYTLHPLDILPGRVYTIDISEEEDGILSQRGMNIYKVVRMIRRRSIGKPYKVDIMGSNTRMTTIECATREEALSHIEPYLKNPAYRKKINWITLHIEKFTVFTMYQYEVAREWRYLKDDKLKFISERLSHEFVSRNFNALVWEV